MDEEKLEQDKALISSEDVLAVVNGDQKALIAQLEKARALAEEELRNSKIANLPIDEQKRIADELKRKEEELALAKKKEQEELERAKLSPAEQKKLARQKAKQEKIEAKRLKKLAQKEKKNKDKKNSSHNVVSNPQNPANQATLAQAALVSGASPNVAQMAPRPDIEQRPTVENQQKIYSSVASNMELSSSQLSAHKNDNVFARQNQNVQSPSPNVVVSNTNPVYNPGTTVPTSQTVGQNVSLPSSVNTQQVSSENLPPVNSSNSNTNSKETKHPFANLKYYMTFIFFALLIWLVVFLPDIRSFISNYFDAKKQEGDTQLTTGVLTCTLNSNDDKYDYYYQADFSFRDSKMYRLIFDTKIKGDQHLDALELSEMKASCDLLEAQTSSLDGIKVSCSLSNGVYENRQQLEYADINSEQLTTAYLEAGGTYPNYQYEQSIDEIEREMNASNYTCERHS